MSATNPPSDIYNPIAHDASSVIALKTGFKVPEGGMPELPDWFVPWPVGAEVNRYSGGCHCGRYKFEFAHPTFGENPDDGGQSVPVVVCNCSVCAINGKMNIYVPASAAYFRFLDSNGEGVPDPSALFASPDLGAHQFNKKVVFHRFCKSCGTHILAHPVEWRTQRPNIVAVNIRTVDGIDLKKVVNVLELDGRNF